MGTSGLQWDLFTFYPPVMPARTGCLEIQFGIRVDKLTVSFGTEMSDFRLRFGRFFPTEI
jgi:hypothetical protein